jgi:flagellar motility protein MotE (MotC chaperone)
VKNIWRDVRLIPVVLLATICLFALKVSGLVFDGGYTLAERLQNRGQPELKVTVGEQIPDYPKIIHEDRRGQVVAAAGSSAKPKPWAQEMFNFNGDSADITGSVGEKDKKGEDGKDGKDAKDAKDGKGGEGGKDGKEAAKPAEKVQKIDGMAVSETPPGDTKVEVGGAVVQDSSHIASPGERAVLERLQERRQELDDRNRSLDMRDSLLKAAEKRINAKLAELRGMETKVDGTQVARQQNNAARFKDLVAMYENMKSKDAARIFDRLDLKILVEVSTQMKPAKMAEIMGLMAPESAERLTVELANRASGNTSPAVDQLPKIQGRPAAR